jgi:uncharacterized protein (UPF0548 family)
MQTTRRDGRTSQNWLLCDRIHVGRGESEAERAEQAVRDTGADLTIRRKR